MNRELNNKLKLLLRSEKALLKLELQRKSRQIVLATIGIIAVLATLVMVNVTTYLFLAESYTPLTSAMVLTGIDLAIAVLFFVVAARQEVGSEADAIHEVRDYALKELSYEVDEIKGQADTIKANFVRMSSGVSAIKALFPLLEMVAKRRKKD